MKFPPSLPPAEARAFGEAVRSHRLRRRVLQRELGAAVQVSESTISYYESGSQVPGLGTLRLMVLFFGCEYSDLLPTPVKVD